MTAISGTALGVSPTFPISAEELTLNYRSAVTRIAIDGVHPPIMGVGGGYSHAMDLINRWFPWIDAKLVEPKFDGVGQWTGQITNRPTFISDYHMISLMRAADRILKPAYIATILVTVTTITPIAPSTPTATP
jgi:hypothetical protein